MATIENPSFFSTDFKTGLVYDNSENKFSSKLYSWDWDELELTSNNSTFYIYVHEGPAHIKSSLHDKCLQPFVLGSRMYACSSGNL